MVAILADRLTVSDGPLNSENAALLRPSDATLPLEELRRRFEENGHLFLKQVLPRNDVLEARNAYFPSLESNGTLKPGSEPDST
ncbi:hypothetical protein N7454_003408 [Penicillium verhagenii]|nr:hypothetical protein N7454_003408 [Penicillium verhagenii]